MYNKSWFFRWLELSAKHMLSVIITSNEIIGNIHKLEAVNAVFMDVQEHQNGSDAAETSLSVNYFNMLDSTESPLTCGIGSWHYEQ